jgi:hypothetical protein
MILKFFIPDTDDRVDAAYDFIGDKFSRQHKEDPTKNDAYVWELFPKEQIPLDGVLVSRGTIERTRKRFHQAQDEGIRKALRIPKHIPIMCDCGAWLYKDAAEPPYKPKEMLEFYNMLGFDLGVTIDHMVLRGMDSTEAANRMEISLQNASEMYRLWNEDESYQDSFRLVGAIQGATATDYGDNFEKLGVMGFDYIALGGMAWRKTGPIIEILTQVKGRLSRLSRKQGSYRKIDIHVFGVNRVPDLRNFAALGVTSFDSTSMLIRSWSRTKDGYVDPTPTDLGDLRGHTAIRVPSERSKVFRNAVHDGQDPERLRELEANAMQSLRSLDKDGTNIQETVKAVLAYEDEVRTTEEHALRGRLSDMYRETLESRPWQRCSCPICGRLGVEVAIFRGNDRNRRRGFHNYWVLHRILHKSLPRMMVVTSCTQKKDTRSGLIPAYRRYSSVNFASFWKNIAFLPVDVYILSGKFGIIPWHKRIPHYEQKLELENGKTKDLIQRLCELAEAYDLVFFYGVGNYRVVFEAASSVMKTRSHILPEGTRGHRPGIREYNAQTKELRRAILDRLAFTEDDLLPTVQRQLMFFL